MIKTAYEPVKGPQHRRRLLRELGRVGARPSFSFSPREVRSSTARMFAFEPLTPLAAGELQLLKRFTTSRNSRPAVNRLAEKALALASGKAKLRVGSQMRLVKPRRSTILQIFSDGKRYARAESFDEQGGGKLYLQGSRELKRYRNGGIDALKITREVAAKKAGVIRVLDVGAATAKMLAELRRKIRGRIETHALSPQDEPREPVDFFHLLTAEYLPEEFRRKFDVIFSHRALEYSLLPHVAIRNISEALAPGGKAVVQWRPGVNLYLEKELQSRIQGFFANYGPGVLSEAGRCLVREALRHTSIRKEMPDGELDELIDKTSAERVGRAGWLARQEVAWLNEVARLANAPDLRVTFDGRNAGQSWSSPAIVTIERRP